MLASEKPPLPALCQRWQRQIGTRYRNQRFIECPRAAVGYHLRGPVRNGFVGLANLVLVVCHYEQRSCGLSAIRIAGFTGTLTPDGVAFGNHGRGGFEYDLRLPPRPGARSPRMASQNRRLLRLALDLEQQLQDHATRGYLTAAAEIRFPLLWAGFQARTAGAITGQGPELEHAAVQFGQAPEALFARSRRQLCGLVLYPLMWVGSQTQSATTIYADLRQFPSTQVVELPEPWDSLRGWRGDCHFDFTHRPHAR